MGKQTVCKKETLILILTVLVCVGVIIALLSCSNTSGRFSSSAGFDDSVAGSASGIDDPAKEQAEEETTAKADAAAIAEQESQAGKNIESIKSTLNLTEDYRPSFVHGDKGARFQKYIMLHDTEGESTPQDVVSWWDSNGNLVATHFIVGKDGAIVQCVPLDKIAHHAGYGDLGNNAGFDVVDESRDDMLGPNMGGESYPDHGMNSYSIGIELVHVGGSGFYPQAQLDALDNLIAYIDAYYGFESKIIDHKAWRSSNSDTSPEFAEYLANYQASRKHGN